MGNHIRIDYGSNIIFYHDKSLQKFYTIIRIGTNGKMGHHISIIFGPTKFHVEKTYVW